MIFNGIAATTEVDRHNCRIEKKALDNAAQEMNNGLYAPGVGLEHDLSIFPIGKAYYGEVKPMENGEYALHIKQDIFFDDCVRVENPNGEILYWGESKLDHRPFADTEHCILDHPKISIDPVNFKEQSFNDISKFIQDECKIDFGVIMRKSLVPDPEVFVELLTGTLLTLAGKKAVEKIADALAVDIVKGYDYLKKVIKKIAQHAIPKNRPITYVFREIADDSYVIELIIKTVNPDDVLMATQEDKIANVIDKINHVTTLVNDSIAKIQFLYEHTISEWKFNYLTTKTGQVWGTEECYKRTATIINKQFTQFSVEGNICEPEDE
mgnify:CR=1 FL=1